MLTLNSLLKGSLLLVFLMLVAFFVQAQTATKKDSLEKIINSSREPDSVRAITALKLGKIFLGEQDSARAADGYFKGLSISKNANFKKGIIKSYIEIGYLFELTQHEDDALRYYNLATEYGAKNSILPDLALAHSYKFFIFSRQSDYKKAIRSADSALIIFTKLGRKLDMANQLNNIGLLNNKMNNNKTAIEYYQKAMALYDELGPAVDQKKMNTINNIGIVFESMKSFDMALKYYKQAYTYAQKNNIRTQFFDASNNIGNIYWNRKDFKKAYAYYYGTLEPAKNLNDPVKYGVALGNVANVLTDLKDYKNAEKYFQLAFKQNQISGNKESLGNNYLNYARMLGLSSQLSLADSYLQKAMQLADKNNMDVLKGGVFESMAEIKKLQKDFDKAYALQDSAIKIKDSTLNIQNNNEIAKLHIQFQTEQKERQLAQNKASLLNNQLELEQKNKMLAISALVLLSVTGLAFYIFSSARNRQKRLKAEARLKLELAGAEARNALQEEKLRISRELHDNIGSQLTFINTSIQNIHAQNGDSVVLAETQKITQNTIADLRRTVWLINKQEVELDEFVIKLRDYVKPLQANNPQFTIEISSSGNCTLDSLAATNLFRIIQESVNNALKYAQAKLIEIQIDCVNDELQLSVADNGIGFQLAADADGFGLKNIKARADALKGSSTINSAPGKGTTIQVKFPVGIYT